jgi:hypothetical protein
MEENVVRPGSSGQPGAEPLPRFPGLARAGSVLGMSGEALRKKFERGDLPRKYLLRVGVQTLRVDLDGLVRFLMAQSGGGPDQEGTRLKRTA